MRSQHITVPKIRNRKGKEKIVMLTAYDALFAHILDTCNIDICLVGDSVATAVLGYPNTLPVGLDEMIHHVQAVSRGASNILIVADMPFGSYQINMSSAKQNAVSLMKAGAHAVKIEGAQYLSLIEELVQMGIPVMGHVGLTPQSIHLYGGYKIQGRNEKQREKIVKDAMKLEAAGIFSLVIEGVPPSLGKDITQSVHIPTIGIGAGPHCDGQVLVITDMLGLNPSFKPKFIKTYANLHDIIVSAVNAFRDDVKMNRFPLKEHCYGE